MESNKLEHQNGLAIIIMVTGKLLFPLGILYTGGDVVSQITGGAPDDFQDKANIAQGYNENTY
jgi:hypothetical protein